MGVSHFCNFPQKFSQNAKILVAPLDWGLGHATRCIPIISSLIYTFNARITVAASGPQKALIREAFPAIPFLSPPKYAVKYHKYRAVTIARLAFAVPKILQTIRDESFWLDEVLEQEKFDVVISDNRYGICSTSIPSYLVTHQLLVKTPFGQTIDRIVQGRIYKLINRFTECWVPDVESGPSLAGELSHPGRMPDIPVRYIGALSRLSPLPPTGNTQLLVLLSGPEPQRTILEKLVIQQWKAKPGRSLVIVRGMPLDTSEPIKLRNALIFNHLSALELSQQVANAEVILSRSGYSSIMDLLPLGKKCFMIPTPGQTEQEYLANYLSSQGRITRVDQNNFDISQIITP